MSTEITKSTPTTMPLNRSEAAPEALTTHDRRTSRRGALKKVLGVAAATMGAAALLEMRPSIAAAASTVTYSASGPGNNAVEADATNQATGVYATSDSGNAVYATSSNGIGVWGSSTNEAGILGTSSNGVGVNGTSNSGPGVYGASGGPDLTFSSGGTGVVGTGSAVGVHGRSRTGKAVYADATQDCGEVGCTPGTGYGVYAAADQGIAVYASSNTGAAIQAQNASSSQSTINAFNTGGNNALYANATKGGIGVYASSDTADGIQGHTGGSGNSGVAGFNTSAGNGVHGQSVGGHGVSGISNGNAAGVSGSGTTGVYGSGTSLNGGPSFGVSGVATNPNGRGVYAQGSAAAVQLVPSGAAHPVSGQIGDLFVDSLGNLWFCKGGTTWKQLA